MAKPKLALIPAAQGTSLYSVLPSSGVGDFDFTRSGSATRINAQGLIETVGSGVSRLNYPMIDGVVKGCPSHILEPQRTQLVQYSEDFSDSSWIKSGPTLTYNQGISPDGGNNATKIIPSTSNTSQDIFATVTALGSTVYTRSFFAKADGYNWIYIQQYDGLTNLGAWFDLSTGLIGNTQSNVTSDIKYYGNDWYKCSVTFTTQSSGSNERAQIRVVGSNGASTLQGNGIDGVLIWGAQVEQGSYPTSYIPNYGTAAGVTRSAETATGSGDAATFNDSEGVLMIESATLSESDITARYFQLSDGSVTANGLTFRYYTTTNYFQALYYTNGAYQAVLSIFLPDSSEFNKIAFKYKTNDFSLFVNGIKVGSDANGSTGYTLSNLSFNNNGFDSFEGSTKQLQYFDTALSDTDLEKLTSWVSFQEMAEGQLYTIE